MIDVEDPIVLKIPPVKDLNIQNTTPNVITVNSQGADIRLIYLLERCVASSRLNFVRETRLNTKEWMSALNFLVKMGQVSTEVRDVSFPTMDGHRNCRRRPSNSIRRNLVLFFDIVGLSLLVDAIHHPRPPASTGVSVMVPFHTHEAEAISHDDLMSHDANGEPCLVVCTIKDVNGKLISKVKIDIWKTNSSGHYDVQHADRTGTDGRCVMQSDDGGVFWFRAIKPVPYPISHNGPVGELLRLLHRHPWRPSHIHFMFEKPEWDHLITAPYLRGDPYETSDAVFDIKDSLIVDLHKVDSETAKLYDVAEGSSLLTYDFGLITSEKSERLRDENALLAMKKLESKINCQIIQ